MVAPANRIHSREHIRLVAYDVVLIRQCFRYYPADLYHTVSLSLILQGKGPVFIIGGMLCHVVLVRAS